MNNDDFDLVVEPLDKNDTKLAEQFTKVLRHLVKTRKPKIIWVNGEPMIVELEPEGAEPS